MPEKAFSFSSITIVGLGLIGGSLALAFRRVGYRGRLIGVSSTRTRALAGKVIDAGFAYEDLAEATAQADLVVLATPIHRIAEHLRELGSCPDALRPGTVVTDVGSTKRALLKVAEESLPAGVHFIGGHPMAGSEKHGFSAADPFLFENAFYALTPAARTPPGETDRLEALLAGIGARVVVLDAELHDRVAAAISHVPQLLAIGLVNFLEQLGGDRDTAVRLAAGGFRDMTRIASSPFEIWRDIYETNVEEVRDMARRLLRHLDAHVEALSAVVERPGELAALFQRAADLRSAIPRDTKGFLRPLSEILVVVEDRPGIIAEITGVLADNGINIKDIEVLKIREGSGGTIRLGFASSEEAQRAAELLSQRGFNVRVRE